MRCHAGSSDPSPFANCHIFSESSLPWSVKYFMHGHKTFITRHSVIQRCSRPNYSAHAGCYSPIQGLCLCWPSDLDISHQNCSMNRAVHNLHKWIMIQIL